MVKADKSMDDETIIGNGKAEGTDLTLRGTGYRLLPVLMFFLTVKILQIV